MESCKLLSLDLSTSCTGWSVFGHNDNLCEYGAIKPKVKNVTTMKYPKQQLAKIHDLVDKILDLIKTYNPETILIEEVNLHKNRLAGKTLDGFHFILLFCMKEKDLNKIKFIDTDGKVGWRSASKLNFKLTTQDKILNKEHRAFNKKVGKGAKKLRIINKKDLAIRYVNKVYNLDLDIKTKSNEDIADSIAMGSAYLKYGE